jgi:hypothetical protein
MQVEEKTTIDAARLREALKKRGQLAPQQARPSTPPRASRIVLPKSPEEEALLLAVHRPEEMAGRLHEALFADDVALAAYRALASASTLHEAIDGADPEAAVLLQRLAVEEDDDEADPDDVIGRLARQAGTRALADLQTAARDAEDPAQFAPAVGWLKLTIEDLGDQHSAVDASDRLVRWLVDRLEVEA